MPDREHHGVQHEPHRHAGEEVPRPPQRGRREQPAQQPGREPDQEQRREHLREQQVLDHVGAEEVEVAQVVERSVERQHHHREPAEVAGRAPGLEALPPASQPPAPHREREQVEQREQRAAREHGPLPAPRPPAVGGRRLLAVRIHRVHRDRGAPQPPPDARAHREGVAQRVQEAGARIVPVILADHRVEPALADVEEVDPRLGPPAHQGALALRLPHHRQAVLEGAHRIHELADQVHAVGVHVAGPGERGRRERAGRERGAGEHDEGRAEVHGTGLLAVRPGGAV